jgi:putative Mg2+ transporter-C (MgtC) family protein
MMSSYLYPEPVGQGLLQFAELALALLLSALIGLEREIRQKSAGLRTYSLVGLASALIILISKYGFTNILADGRVVLDPSRMAAQIVSGIGFIGGGVIFVRKDLVRGLTTATTIWVTSAVGMACGAGLPLLAIAVTAANFVVVFGFRPLERILPKSRWAPSSLRVSYQDGRGLLRDILATCTQQDFAVTGVEIERDDARAFDRRGKHSGKARAMAPAYAAAAGPEENEEPTSGAKPTVTVMLELRGGRSLARLVDKLSEIEGVFALKAGDAGLVSD